MDSENGFPEKYDMVGLSNKMTELYRKIEVVAPTDKSVLITGESGTGKELVAKALYKNSLRNKRPYVIVNCAAIPKDLLESELFGHERGAFTGAMSTRVGKFEMANEGTLFLDEIADMSKHHQAKVLRALEDGSFERIGSNQSRKTDFRLIASTNEDIKQAIKDGKFRKDLYYRINGISIHVPTLRERGEKDIALLIGYFLNENNGGKRISPRALDSLVSYEWPGNVRELIHKIDCLAVLSEGDEISMGDVCNYMEFEEVLEREHSDKPGVIPFKTEFDLDAPIPISYLSRETGISYWKLRYLVRTGELPHTPIKGSTKRYAVKTGDAINYFQGIGNSDYVFRLEEFRKEEEKDVYPSWSSTLSELSKNTGINRDTLLRAIHRGNIPASKRDGKYIVEIGDAIRYLKRTNNYSAISNLREHIEGG